MQNRRKDDNIPKTWKELIIRLIYKRTIIILTFIASIVTIFYIGGILTASWIKGDDGRLHLEKIKIDKIDTKIRIGKDIKE